MQFVEKDSNILKVNNLKVHCTIFFYLIIIFRSLIILGMMYLRLVLVNIRFFCGFYGKTLVLSFRWLKTIMAGLLWFCLRFIIGKHTSECLTFHDDFLVITKSFYHLISWVNYMRMITSKMIINCFTMNVITAALQE